MPPPGEANSAQGGLSIDIDIPIDTLTDSWLPAAAFMVLLLAIAAVFQPGPLSFLAGSQVPGKQINLYYGDVSTDSQVQAQVHDGKLVYTIPFKGSSGTLNSYDTWTSQDPSDTYMLQFRFGDNQLEGVSETFCTDTLGAKAGKFSRNEQGETFCDYSFQTVLTNYNVSTARYTFKTGDRDGARLGGDGQGTANVTAGVVKDTPSKLVYAFRVPKQDIPFSSQCDPPPNGGYWCDALFSAGRGSITLVVDLDGDGDGVVNLQDSCPGTSGGNAEGCPVEASPSPQEPSSEPVQDDGESGGAGGSSDGGSGGTGGDTGGEETLRQAIIDFLTFWN